MNVEHKENILKIVNYLKKIDLLVTSKMWAFEKNTPCTMEGHMAFALDYPTTKHKNKKPTLEEIQGLSIFDYIQYRTNFELKDMSIICKFKKTYDAAQYIKEKFLI
jgi:hypothetical protein